MVEVARIRNEGGAKLGRQLDEAASSQPIRTHRKNSCGLLNVLPNALVAKHIPSPAAVMVPVSRRKRLGHSSPPQV